MNLFKTPTPDELKKAELQSEEEQEQWCNKHCMRVKLTLEKTTFDIDYIKAERQDGVIHQTVFQTGMFYTWRLAHARKRLIREIELITGRSVIIVLDFNKPINITN